MLIFWTVENSAHKCPSKKLTSWLIFIEWCRKSWRPLFTNVNLLTGRIIYTYCMCMLLCYNVKYMNHCVIYCITASLCQWTARMNQIKWGSITMKKHLTLRLPLQLFPCICIFILQSHTYQWIERLTRLIKWKHIANERLLMNILTSSWMGRMATQNIVKVYQPLISSERIYFIFMYIIIDVIYKAGCWAGRFAIYWPYGFVLTLTCEHRQNIKW